MRIRKSLITGGIIQSGMVVLHKEQSAYDFNETCERISKFLESRNIPIFATIDHRDNAEKAGLTLRPEKVILFGSPMVGTHLIEENPDIGLELPMRILVFQIDSSVIVGYFDYDSIVDEYHISKSLDFAKRLAKLMKELSVFATHR